MIAFKNLTEIMQERINLKAQDLGFNDYHFYIHTDTGDFKKPERFDNEVTEYINGLMTLLSSDITNVGRSTESVRFGTMSARLQFIVSLPNEEEDKEYKGKVIEGSKSVIYNVRAILDSVAQNTATENITGEDGENYFVSTFINFADTGIRSQVNQVGDSITFGLYITYLFVENGVNADYSTFVLDGYRIPFQTFTISKVATSDNNVYADTTTAETEATQLQTSWNVVFELPATKGKVFGQIIDYILRGKPNTIHILECDFVGGLKREIDRRIVFNNNSAINGQTMTNLGIKVAFENARVNYFNNIVPEIYNIYRAKSAVNAKINSSLTEKYLAYNMTAKAFPDYVDNVVKCNTGDIVIATKGTFSEQTLTNFEIIRG